MKRLRSFFILAILFSIFVSNNVFSQTYKIAVGDLPGMEPTVELMKDMGKEMNVNIEINLVPMQRMINMVISEKADIGLPMIAVKNNNKIKNLPFDYSTVSMNTMAFVLYTNKSNSIDIESLKKGNPKGYKIESDISNQDLFDFSILVSTNIEGSLRKIDAKRIDGYIMGQLPTDDILKTLKLKSIKRQLFDTFEIVFVLKKGAKGTDVDKFLSTGLKKLKDTGIYGEYASSSVANSSYKEWQP